MAEKADKERGPMGGTMKIATQIFLETDHYRKLHRILAEQWSGCHSLTAAMRLMEAHGVKVGPEDERALLQLPEERMIDALVSRMPQQSREQFEHFFLQLSFIASTTTRVRAALELGDPRTVEEALESAENVGVLPFLMKMAVTQAGQEVRAYEGEHDKWLAETETRMSPLLQSQATAVVTQKALAAAKAQMDEYQSDSKEKSKAVLLGMARGNDKAFMSTMYLAWADMTKRAKLENEILQEYGYREKIDLAQKKLFEYRQAQLGNVRAVMAKTALDDDLILLTSCVTAMLDEVEDVKKKRNGSAALSDVEAKLKNFTDSASGNAKKVLARMNAGNEDACKSMAWSSWVAYVEDYKKDKQMNDELKAKEAAIEEFKKKQKGDAQKVLGRMTAASESGLVANMFQLWKELVADLRQGALMEEQLAQKSAQMNKFNSRSKKSATTTSERTAQLIDTCLISFTFCHWKREWKVEFMKQYGKSKSDKRKQELVGVKTLFKDFANKLETSLKEGTPRPEPKRAPLSPKQSP
mmetsp:Transcript_72053/g.203534  ORF Transcript_72053/g.203534 Transcript_72053/m.203534 type:complete len:526 (-) Transcript_72053:171-1748(-)